MWWPIIRIEKSVILEWQPYKISNSNRLNLAPYKPPSNSKDITSLQRELPPALGVSSIRNESWDNPTLRRPGGVLLLNSLNLFVTKPGAWSPCNHFLMEKYVEWGSTMEKKEWTEVVPSSSNVNLLSFNLFNSSC
jgi:hypothetical protein